MSLPCSKVYGRCHLFARLEMIKNISNIMNENEKKMVKTASLFISLTYCSWFFKRSLSIKTPVNDLVAFKDVFDLSKKYPEFSQSILKSMQNHTWYLSQQLVVMALVDDDVEKDDKKNILQKLLQFPVPEEFMKGKPKMPVNTSSTTLSNLVGDQSWILFCLAKVIHDQVKLASQEDLNVLDNFKFFVKNMEATNDCAERNIKLIQDFIMSYRNEDMKQNVLLVAKNHRKTLNKNLTNTQLIQI